MDENRIEIFERNFFRKDKDGDNFLEVSHRDSDFYFTIENPWAGDTETGFGQETSVHLDTERATRLYEFLKKKLDK